MRDIKLNCTNNEKIIYLNGLIGRVYKILPLYEDMNEALIIYIDSLLLNISSANYLFDDSLIELIIKINELKINKIEHKILRKSVFECINMIKQKIEDVKRDDNNGKSIR
ncbi:hypothetical protein [Clostridium sp.]|uniref:hypothetical protein n=1 Tax=Clostridium sp. TaxID=1506 RepID=UPI0026135FE8|nr:hypothetical protein [Clostridium sp.]